MERCSSGPKKALYFLSQPVELATEIATNRIGSFEDYIQNGGKTFIIPTFSGTMDIMMMVLVCAKTY